VKGSKLYTLPETWNFFEDTTSGARITKEACREFRNVMAQVRTWCEWKLEQLKRYQTFLPQRRSFTSTDFRIREATGLPTLP
jgi:hypothetical protein